eukprot:3674051-Rhodomonas_salina.1
MRLSYAMPGTDMAYAAMRCPDVLAACGTEAALAMLAAYALLCTERAYGPMVLCMRCPLPTLCVVLTERPLFDQPMRCGVLRARMDRVRSRSSGAARTVRHRAGQYDRILAVLSLGSTLSAVLSDGRTAQCRSELYCPRTHAPYFALESGARNGSLSSVCLGQYGRVQVTVLRCTLYYLTMVLSAYAMPGTER